ncbi:MAG: fumarylacetoacetate hydrolase family protein [Anaerolineae bacterium]|nr:fumarylacetoacetate hydrolase family protein [Anaerolineae bacterium]
MKLLTFRHKDGLRLGALLGSLVVDLAAAFQALPPEAKGAHSHLAALPADMLSFLQAGPPVWQAAQSVANWVHSSGLADTAAADFLSLLSKVHLGPPVPNPGKIIGVGMNYADHAREQNLPPPKAPILFAKFSTAVIGPGEAITWPAEASSQVDYEAELAVVIGRRARLVTADEAYDYIAGYTIVNDVTARDVQFGDGQWVRGKSFDTFCPMGPYLVTADEVGDPHKLAIRCQLNGVVMQDSNTDQLIFDIPMLVEFISRTCTLLPGDVICTGTPHGVGVFRDPPVFLKPGDLVEVEIERIGLLSNPVAAAAARRYWPVHLPTGDKAIIP